MDTSDIINELETMKTIVSPAKDNINWPEFQRCSSFIESCLKNTSPGISYRRGDILQSDANIIVHQVNCMGVMGAGLAKQIRDKYPLVYNMYRSYCDVASSKRPPMGKAQIIPVNRGQYIANCFAQIDYRRSGQDICLTDYNALRTALKTVREFAVDMNAKTVALPFWLGCGLAGGNWAIVRDIIDAELGNSRFAVQIFKK